jgi:hypothetical protein
MGPLNATSCTTPTKYSIPCWAHSTRPMPSFCKRAERWQPFVWHWWHPYDNRTHPYEFFNHLFILININSFLITYLCFNL